MVLALARLRGYNAEMSNYPKAILKKAKEGPLIAGHPWIFSNALAVEPQADPGALVSVYTHNDSPLGIGCLNPLTSIRIRMISRDINETIDANYFATKFRFLYDYKKKFLGTDTNAFRLAHGDADNLPGLIIDLYDKTAVFQIHTAGMDLLREAIIEGLCQALSPESIVERSDLSSRQREGLKDEPKGCVFGELQENVSFQENGLHFKADVLNGQKTGFFLDQRETRRAIQHYAPKRNVLNLFAYSGASSVYAATGGAKSITTLDISEKALGLAHDNFLANNLDPEDNNRFQFLKADAFEYCKDPEFHGVFDFIICDPPAFAKTLAKKKIALEAYRRVNRLCFEMLAPQGILVTSSCSGVVSMEEFRQTLKYAASQAKRDPITLNELRQPFDHTEKLSFPEGRYLKSLIFLA